MFRGEELPAHSTAGGNPGKVMSQSLGFARLQEVMTGETGIEGERSAKTDRQKRAQATKNRRQREVGLGGRERDRRGS